MITQRLRRGRAFTLIELLVVIAIIALLISILLPALGKARKSARLAKCESNMNQYAKALTNYNTDYRGAMCQFNNFKTTNFTQWSDLNALATQGWVQAHAAAGIDIVRRNLPSSDVSWYGAVTGRMLDRNYGHLPLIDGGYFSEHLPEPATACPEDFNTNVWQRAAFANSSDPSTFNAALAATGGDPDPSAELTYKHLFPFWSTYQFVPNAWAPETGSNGANSGNVIYQADGAPGYHMLYTIPFTSFAITRRQDDVVFPSQKVWLFDLYDRHFYKRTIWYAYPIASQPLVFFDGSVSIRKTKDSNPGWNPLSPGTAANPGPPTWYHYWPVPGSSDPPTLSGASSDLVKGWYRWTRRGLRGVDYGGGEVKN